VGDPNAQRVGGALLAAAGLYELTPLKDLCLRHCRSPIGIVMQYADLLANGHRGPFRVGLVHGLYCVGCCWSLMLVLVLLGIMNLVWMGVVASVIFAEKVLPGGALLSRVTGIAPHRRGHHVGDRTSLSRVGLELRKSLTALHLLTQRHERALHDGVRGSCHPQLHLHRLRRRIADRRVACSDPPTPAWR